MNCGDGEKGSPSGPPRTVSVAGILFCVGTKGYSVQCRRWLTSGCVLESATIVSILNNCKRKRVACVQVLGQFLKLRLLQCFSVLVLCVLHC